MAQYLIPYQNLSFFVPDEGQLFRSNNSGPWQVMVRKGGKLYVTNASDFGGDWTALPQYQVGGEMLQALTGLGGGTVPFVQSSPTQVKSIAASTPVREGEVITQNISPVNPNGIQVTSTFPEPDAVSSPSTTQALLNAGATTQQAATLSQAQQSNQVVTPEQAASAGIPTATAPTPVAPPPDQVPPQTPTSTPVSQTAPISTSSVTPPSVNLQPGQSGSDVAQLQQWLISQGYDIPAISSGSTQPGFFGDQTRAALIKWQTDHNVDTQGNPGFYGPITQAAIGITGASTSTQNTQSTPAPNSAVSTPSMATTGASTATPASPQQAVLTPEQQSQYFASQSSSPTPLSPAQWLAQQGTTQTTPTTVPTTTPTGTPASQTGTSVPTQTPQTGTVLPSVNNTQFDSQLQQLLTNPNLTADQKKAIEAIFNATSTNDQQLATKFISAMNASTEFSTPFFKAQTALVTDALTRGLQANEGDLSYRQDQLNRTLNTLRENTAASLNQLDFTNQQELKNLALSLEKDLEDNAQNLAATGKTFSSIRSRTDKLINENNQGLVESSRRQFGFQQGNLNRALSTAESNTTRDLAYLTDKNTQARIAALREAEQKVGSDALRGAGFNSGLLGNIFGALPQQQQEKAISAGRLATGNPAFIF